MFVQSDSSLCRCCCQCCDCWSCSCCCLVFHSFPSKWSSRSISESKPTDGLTNTNAMVITKRPQVQWLVCESEIWVQWFPLTINHYHQLTIMNETHFWFQTTETSLWQNISLAMMDSINSRHFIARKNAACFGRTHFLLIQGTVSYLNLSSTCSRHFLNTKNMKSDSGYKLRVPSPQMMFVLFAGQYTAQFGNTSASTSTQIVVYLTTITHVTCVYTNTWLFVSLNPSNREFWILLHDPHPFWGWLGTS